MEEKGADMFSNPISVDSEQEMNATEKWKSLAGYN